MRSLALLIFAICLVASAAHARNGECNVPGNCGGGQGSIGGGGTVSKEEAQCLAESASRQLQSARSDFYRMIQGAQECMMQKMLNARCPAGSSGCGRDSDEDTQTFESEAFDYLKSKNTFKTGMRAAVKRVKEVGEACVKLARCSMEHVIEGIDAIFDQFELQGQNRIIGD